MGLSKHLFLILNIFHISISWAASYHINASVSALDAPVEVGGLCRFLTEDNHELKKELSTSLKKMSSVSKSIRVNAKKLIVCEAINKTANGTLSLKIYKDTKPLFKEKLEHKKGLTLKFEEP